MEHQQKEFTFFDFGYCTQIDTLPETNIAPENGWLECYFPIGFRPIFRGKLLVSGRVMVVLLFASGKLV